MKTENNILERIQDFEKELDYINQGKGDFSKMTSRQIWDKEFLIKKCINILRWVLEE